MSLVHFSDEEETSEQTQQMASYAGSYLTNQPTALAEGKYKPEMNLLNNIQNN